MLDGCGSKPMVYHFGVGEFTTHLRTYFSGWIESDVQWGYDLALDFDPWPSCPVPPRASVPPCLRASVPPGAGGHGFEVSKHFQFRGYVEELQGRSITMEQLLQLKHFAVPLQGTDMIWMVEGQ